VTMLNMSKYAPSTYILKITGKKNYLSKEVKTYKIIKNQ
jgi:hypothetical protein